MVDLTLKESFNGRPVIHRIILHNFKSYFGTQTLGPFDNHFTSIVGANGNGKSNAIDAIQFVFGKRGKQMRANKVRELVWQGSIDLEARVEIIFRFVLENTNTEEQYQMDESTGSIKELKISRIIPSGSTSTSKYQINDKSSTYLELQEILKALSIEPINDRFLILQGEVEAISQMKSLDLLDYLSNIIGTTEYTEPIEEAKKRFEQSNQERDMQYDRLRHNEAILDALEGPVTEAQHITKKKIQKNEILYQQKLLNFVQASDNILLCKKDLKETKTRKAQISDQLLKRQNANRDSELKNISLRKHYDTLVSAMELCKQNVYRYENERVHLKQEIKNIKSRLNKLAKSSQGDEASFASKINGCDERIESLTREIKSVEQHLDMSKQSLESLTNEYQSQLDPILNEMKEVREQSLPLSTRINILENELKVKFNQQEKIKSRAMDQEKDQNELKTQIQSIQNDLSQFQREFESSSNELLEIKTLLQQKRNELEFLSQQIFGKESLRRGLELELSEIEQTSDQYRSFNLVYDTLMECKRVNRISGICDKLANCGEVDEKLKVALFAACQHMNTIVTDDVKSASSCVEYLQKHKVGIGRFIMLDRLAYIEQKMYKHIDSLPVGSRRLFDLIQFKEEKFKTAFYFALKDTLVADNIHEARRLAFGGSRRYRVVTLKGELIEATGSMSSGSNLEQIMLMTTISSTLQKKRDEFQQIVTEHELLQHKRAEVDHVVSKLEENFRDKKFSNEKLSFNISKLEKSLEQLRSSVNNTTLIEDESNIIEQLEVEIQNLNCEIASLKENNSIYEISLEDLKKKLENVGGSTMQDHRTKIELLQKQLDETKSKIAKNIVKKEQFEKQWAKLQETNQKSAAQREAFETKLKELEESLSNLLENGDTLQDDFKRAEEDKLSMEKQLKAFDDEQEKVQSKYHSLKLQEAEIANDEKNLLQKLTEYEKQQIYWRKEMNKILSSLSKDWEILYIFDLNLAEKIRSNNDNDDAMEDIQESDAMQEIEENDSNEIKMCEELKKFVEHTHNLTTDEIDEEELSTNLQTIEAELFQFNEKSNHIKSLVEEYKAKKDVYIKQHSTFTTLSEERNRIQMEYDALRRQRLEQFMKGFLEITLKLKEIYQMITMGGDAELELVDRHDPFKGGIIFSVKPPRKSWRKIQNLSGGEKTLSSLALIFALHHYKPTPLYIMDEIDAALDYRNVAIVGHYIKQRTKNAQFIVISLRNSMFELADRLVGIFKVENKTKSVSVQPKCIIEQSNRMIDSEGTIKENQRTQNRARMALNPLEVNTM